MWGNESRIRIVELGWSVNLLLQAYALDEIDTETDAEMDIFKG